MEIKKIYFDMDGVLANFDKGIKDLCHMEPYKQGTRSQAEDDYMWTQVKEVDNFYYRLEFIEGTKDIFNELKNKYNEKVEILTGIPKPRHGILTSKIDKENWVKDYLSSDTVVNVCLREEKILKVTGKDSILIDDYQKNIDEWEENGGTGILFISAEDLLKKLKDLNIL